MPRRTCAICQERAAVLKRPKTFQQVGLLEIFINPSVYFSRIVHILSSGWLVVQICKDCFFDALENEVHDTIATHKLFNRGDVVALGASGGKDSTVLAHMMKLLNERHKYGFRHLLPAHAYTEPACGTMYIPCASPMRVQQPTAVQQLLQLRLYSCLVGDLHLLQT
jgi:hypothetical protein